MGVRLQKADDEASASLVPAAETGAYRPLGSPPPAELAGRDDLDDAALVDDDGPAGTTTNGVMTPNGHPHTPPRVVVSFWLLGLLNNASYVVMIASAESIAAGGAALVYLADIVPGSCTKASSPFWFDAVGYRARLIAATALMASSFALVGPVGAGSLGLQLLGVACCSAQSALGEASLLALASRYPRRGSEAVAAWASGTGFAGVFGYAWVIAFTEVLGLGEVGAQSVALVTLPPAFCVAFYALLRIAPPEPVATTGAAAPLRRRRHHGTRHDAGDASDEDDVDGAAAERRRRRDHPHESSFSGLLPSSPSSSSPDGQFPDNVSAPSVRPVEVSLGWRARLGFALSLWRVTGAVCAVYFAEYAMQSGVWAAMGFPVTSSKKRHRFYEYSNTLYQCGVLVSRSSGFFVRGRVPRRALWAMALAQLGILAFFFADALVEWWYDYTVLALCFVVGLFGGAVYVHGFRILAADVHPDLRELAMTVGAFAADAGTLLSNVLGLFLQACLYERHAIDRKTVVTVAACRRGRGSPSVGHRRQLLRLDHRLLRGGLGAMGDR